MGRPGTRQLDFWVGAAVLALSAAAFSPGFASYYYYDDIRWLADQHRLRGAGDFFRWVFQRESEHLIPFTKAGIFALRRIFGLSFVPAQATALAQLLVAELLILALAHRWLRTRAARWAWVGLFGTSPVYIQAVVDFSASAFTTSLILTLLALLGVELYGDGRRRAGLALCAAGAFLAPMGIMIGLPAGAWAAGCAWLRLRRGRGMAWREAMPPAAVALAGTAAFLVVWKLCPHPFGPLGKHTGGGALPRVDLPRAASLLSEALYLHQFGGFALRPFGPIIVAASLAALMARKGRIDLTLALLAWIVGNLAYVCLFRSALHCEKLASWGRYHLFPAVGTAGLAALAIDEIWGGERLQASLRRSRAVRPAAAVLFLVFLAVNAAATAWTDWDVHVKGIRRFVRPFILQWSHASAAYSEASGFPAFELPDVWVEIDPWVPGRPLSHFSFAWTKEDDARVRWVPAERGFDPAFVRFITGPEEFGAVRHYLRESLYPEKYGKGN